MLYSFFNKFLLFLNGVIFFLSEIPLEKPLPLKYHLFSKQLPNRKVSENDEEDDNEFESTSEEKQAYHQHGSITYSIQCKIISPGVTLPGILTITTDSLYFTADEDCDEVKNVDPKVFLILNFLSILYPTRQETTPRLTCEI